MQHTPTATEAYLTWNRAASDLVQREQELALLLRIDQGKLSPATLQLQGEVAKMRLLAATLYELALAQSSAPAGRRHARPAQHV